MRGVIGKPMKGSGPPPLSRAVLSAVALAAVPGTLALFFGGLGDALVTFAITGAVILAFYVSWSRWDARPRPLRFDFAFLAVFLTAILVWFVIDTVESGLEQGVIAIAPVFAIIGIWLVMRRVLGTRTRPPAPRQKDGS